MPAHMHSPAPGVTAPLVFTACRSSPRPPTRPRPRARWSLRRPHRAARKAERRRAQALLGDGVRVELRGLQKDDANGLRGVIDGAVQQSGQSSRAAAPSYGVAPVPRCPSRAVAPLNTGALRLPPCVGAGLRARPVYPTRARACARARGWAQPHRPPHPRLFHPSMARLPATVARLCTRLCRPLAGGVRHGAADHHTRARQDPRQQPLHCRLNPISARRAAAAPTAPVRTPTLPPSLSPLLCIGCIHVLDTRIVNLRRQGARGKRRAHDAPDI